MFACLHLRNVISYLLTFHIYAAVLTFDSGTRWVVVDADVCSAAVMSFQIETTTKHVVFVNKIIALQSLINFVRCYD